MQERTQHGLVDFVAEYHRQLRNPPPEIRARLARIEYNALMGITDEDGDMAKTKLMVNMDASDGLGYPVHCTLEHPDDTVVASGHGERLELRHVGDDTCSVLLRAVNAFGDINDAAPRAAQQQRNEYSGRGVGIRDYLRTPRGQEATAADDSVILTAPNGWAITEVKLAGGRFLTATLTKL